MAVFRPLIFLLITAWSHSAIASDFTLSYLSKEKERFLGNCGCCWHETPITNPPQRHDALLCSEPGDETRAWIATGGKEHRLVIIDNEPSPFDYSLGTTIKRTYADDKMDAVIECKIRSFGPENFWCDGQITAIFDNRTLIKPVFGSCGC